MDTRERTRAALAAVASVRPEGGEPTKEFLNDLQDAVTGSISGDELRERTIARYRNV